MEKRIVLSIILMVALGSLVLVQQNATNQTSGNYTAQAEQCDSGGINHKGGGQGNSNKCSGEDFEPPREPNRDCARSNSDELHKNALKDNDGDGVAGCIYRGDAPD